MIQNPDDLTEGQTVYLFPHTKTASRAVHKQLTVKVMRDPKAFWPWVLVKWNEPDGSDFWEKVHRDDIKLKPSSAASTPAGRKEGDGPGSNTVPALGTNRRTALRPEKRYEIELPPGTEQGELF
jgi:hypothetical protein